jgi:hypothetical protein
MPITIKDVAQEPVKREPVQRNIASLVGGFVIALGCFVLFLLVASEITHGPPNLPVMAAGALLAGAIGGWIRLADL